MSTSLGVALVTGAGRGLGRAIALRLAKDGYDVALNDLAPNKALLEQLGTEIASSGRKFAIVPADVTSEADVKGMVEQTVKDLGGVDVMIANAGIVMMKPLLDVEVSEWDKVQAVNGRGTFLCYKYAAKQMVTQGRGGRIIGASSLAGKQGWSHLSTYSSSKFLVRGLTQAAAAELAPHKITVNAYAPGIVDTAMKKVLGESSGDEDAFFKGYSDRVPVGRFGVSDEIAGLVSYLVSKEASYITGMCISINGGIFFD
ncbi:hypothetical protein PC9H_011089 [Pleurotus ostreatus]|uniref:Uncharacterized protein n=1 Tax=Pleurotus ostreatus TaxID=5322 RepID=A0A8H7DQB3_PLEOS|nr:uncharacterized protein PC9H_011089 [Pleurotus ostreatus]KAF7422925.1 hypothetical protein PC9H_011089 [Pleurotus ostreatus]